MERVRYVEDFLLCQSASGKSDATVRNHRAALHRCTAGRVRWRGCELDCSTCKYA
jgi:hypothetical protein